MTNKLRANDRHKIKTQNSIYIFEKQNKKDKQLSRENVNTRDKDRTNPHNGIWFEIFSVITNTRATIKTRPTQSKLYEKSPIQKAQ